MGLVVLARVFEGIDLFLTIVSYILFGYCVMSWIARPGNRLYLLLSRMAQPLLAPFRPIARKLIMRGFPFDISVVLAFLALALLRRGMWMLFARLIQ